MHVSMSPPSTQRRITTTTKAIARERVTSLQAKRASRLDIGANVGSSLNDDAIDRAEANRDAPIHAACHSGNGLFRQGRGFVEEMALLERPRLRCVRGESRPGGIAKTRNRAGSSKKKPGPQARRAGLCQSRQRTGRYPVRDHNRHPRFKGDLHETFRSLGSQSSPMASSPGCG